jgi:hypothetical protein
VQTFEHNCLTSFPSFAVIGTPKVIQFESKFSAKSDEERICGMKRKRFSVEQIVTIVKQAEMGCRLRVDSACANRGRLTCKHTDSHDEKLSRRA